MKAELGASQSRESFVDATSDRILYYYVGSLYVENGRQETGLNKPFDAELLALAIELAEVFGELQSYLGSSYAVELEARLADESFRAQAVAYFLPSVVEQMPRRD
jgi:hypothetical protein